MGSDGTERRNPARARRSRPRLRLSVVATVVATLALGAGSAGAGVAGSRDDDQHGGTGGHLPATAEHVELVSKLKVSRAGAHRVADVAVSGDWAYLAAFEEPVCEQGGVYVVDVSDPARPVERSFIPASPGTFVGEGVQVVRVHTAFFRGDLLIHNNEICGPEDKGESGVSLWDVSDPLHPDKLVGGFGDFTEPEGQRTSVAHQVHSAFAWTTPGKAYAVLIDDDEGRDVDILDLTDPRHPVVVAETGLPDWPQALEHPAPYGENPHFHDVVVETIGGSSVMLLSYWDAGFVQLNVNDPAHPVFLGHTDYGAVDPERAARGDAVSPEGNAHQAEFTHDHDFFVAADEDFAPYRVQVRFADRDHPATQPRGEAPQITPEHPLEAGESVFVGLACAAASVPPASATAVPIAVVERGGCDLADKVAAVSAAGYRAAVVFNRTGDRGGCETLPSKKLKSDIPVLFVGRSTGLELLGALPPGYSCKEDGTDAPPPAVGTRGAAVGALARFDGWGYVHLFSNLRRPDGRYRELDTYAIAEAEDGAFAEGFGDLSVHEVATDPDTNLAYLSYYGGGLRVVRYGEDGLEEVGRYIDPGGNNLWGIEVQKRRRDKLIFASDRDLGLFIFRYTGP